MSAIHGGQVGLLEEHAEEGRSLNWWGMVFFIASEALIFANFIASYLYLEIRGGHWTLPNGELLPWQFTAFNTLLLIGSSFTMHFASEGIAKGDKKRLVWGLFATILLGAIFLGGQSYEYSNLFSEGFTIGYKTFGSAFFMLTGFHGLHVTIGVIFLIICLIRALRGDFTAKNHFAVEAGAMYWHFVDIVWIVVFSTVYLLPYLLPR